MNRMHRFHALGIALFLCVHGPVAAETVDMATGEAQGTLSPPQNSPAPDRQRAKGGKRTTLTHKAGRSAQDPRPLVSEFVRLGQAIVNNAFDPAIADRILATRETLWAFGPIDPGSPLSERTPEANALPGAIAIRPLNLEPGAFNPFFGVFFMPMTGAPLLTTAEDMASFRDIAGLDPSHLSPQGTPAPEMGTGSGFTAGTTRTPFAYRYAMDKKTSVNAGVAWISDLGDTTGIAEVLENPEGEGPSANRLSGVNLSLGASYRAVTLTGGYIRALDTRTSTELALEGKESDPIAWNSELAYSTELLRRETTLAVGYQKSSDALHAYLPEERYRTRASMALSDSTVFSLEYYQDREFPARNGEEDGYGITTRIGFDF